MKTITANVHHFCLQKDSDGRVVNILEFDTPAEALASKETIEFMLESLNLDSNYEYVAGDFVSYENN